MEALGDSGASGVGQPRVTIITPCRNEIGHIHSFIASVRAQEQPPGGMEVIVADGASTDGTREVLDQWARSDDRVRIIHNPRGTVPAGLNAAIRESNGDIIVRMDVHVEYPPDYIRAVVRVLQETGADNVGGPCIARSANSWPQRANALAFGCAFSTGGARFHDPAYEGEVDTVPFGCWWRHRLIELGLFDEELVRNQDDELNLRLKLSGGRIWQTPDIRSWYWPRATLSALFRQQFQYGYWKVRVIRKHRRAASWRHLVPAVAFLVGAGLGVAGLVYRPAWAVLGLLVVLYLVLNAGFSLVAVARSRQWDLLPVLPVVFSIYHFAYGVGFLLGIVDAVARGGRRRLSMESLTR
jgi:succinoglycan biosynthesis protein ExoA